MASTDTTKVYRVGGRLCVDPTDLGIAYPYGGTNLGAINKVRLSSEQLPFFVTAEEYSSTAVEAIDLRSDVIATAVIRQRDDDAISTVWPSTSTGGTTGEQVIDMWGSSRAGELLSANAVKLLFSPYDSRHPGWILYNALPYIPEPEIRFAVKDEMSWPAQFLGTQDSSSRVGKIGRISDLVL